METEALIVTEDAPFFPEADDAQPAAAGHGVKIAAEVGSRRFPRYVVECRCGWSSPILGSPLAANDLYAKHKAGG